MPPLLIVNILFHQALDGAAELQLFLTCFCRPVRVFRIPPPTLSRGEIFRVPQHKAEMLCQHLRFVLGYPDNKALNPIDFCLIQMFVNL